jgi:hypothetical protein
MTPRVPGAGQDVPGSRWWWCSKPTVPERWLAQAGLKCIRACGSRCFQRTTENLEDNNGPRNKCNPRKVGPLSGSSHSLLPFWMNSSAALCHNSDSARDSIVRRGCSRRSRSPPVHCSGTRRSRFGTLARRYRQYRTCRNWPSYRPGCTRRCSTPPPGRMSARRRRSWRLSWECTGPSSTVSRAGRRCRRLRSSERR